MEDKNINTKLYIPSNVKTRFEFIRGFGINELIVPVLIVLLGGAAMVIITAKDTNNLSVLDMIKNMLEFASMQKVYKYKYFDKWRS